MQKRQVAVLDIGSSKITVIIGERGINETFLIKGKYSVDYDGFCEGEFVKKELLPDVLNKAISEIKRFTRRSFDTVYVGVSGEFTKVTVKDCQISFPRKKRITEEDVNALYDSASVSSTQTETLISRSAVLFELDDFRRVSNPLGCQSEILKGKLSFVLCSNYFINTIVPILKNLGITNIKCIPTPFAEALYLLGEETRNRLAVIADIGYISSSVTVVLGGGIIYQDSFSYGGGFITAALSDKFGIDFDVAERLKRKVNLCSIMKNNCFNVIDAENGEYFQAEQVKQVVLDSIDELCEKLYNSLDSFGETIPDYVPLFITGGGITFLRGAKERIMERLGMQVEILSPAVPLMDKPVYSSELSLLDIALGE